MIGLPEGNVSWDLGKFKAYELSNIQKESYRLGVNWNLDSWDSKVVQPPGAT